MASAVVVGGMVALQALMMQMAAPVSAAPFASAPASWEVLPVVAVPEPPAPPESGAESGAAYVQPVVASCPVELRGIVAGETPATTFAVLGGAGGSALLHVGQGVRTARGWYTVSSIAAQHVIVRHRNGAYRCALGR